jgi:hypothetical protein
MLRLRFSSGLILGLVIGVPVGLLIGVLMLPARVAESGAPTSLQVMELTRKLEAAKENKERTDRQLEQFQKLAEQMTATFKSLEQRFNALEEVQRLHEPQQPPQPEAKASASPTTVAAMPTPASSPSPPSSAGSAGSEPEDDSTNSGG